MTKFKMGDLVQLTLPFTMPVGTVLVVLSNNELAGQLIVAPVNDEHMAILEEVGSNSFKIDSTYVEAASAAARVLYGKNDR